MRNFECVDNELVIGGVKATEIVKRYGSPVYVTDENAVRNNYHRIYQAFSKRMPTRINYACKSNTNLAVLIILEQEGSCIDAVSIGEIEACLRSGFSPDRILYTGVNVSNAELKAVVSKGVPINIDSFSELERLSKITTNHTISFRVNPEVGSGHHDKVITGKRSTKFGIPKHQIIDAYKRAVELGFKPSGIHAHIGSGGQKVEPFIELIDELIKIVQELETIGIDLRFIDIGGGIGIPYRLDEVEMDLDKMAEEITSRIKSKTKVKEIIIEPGRYIIADSTILLATVVDIKETPDKMYAGIDAGFNTLIRPAMYDSYHHVAVANKFGDKAEETYSLGGPICETGDVMAKDRELPKVEEGDIIAVYDAGAYGFTMASNYNMRPLPREVLVKDGEVTLIRESETIEELFRHQRIPSRLML